MSEDIPLDNQQEHTNFTHEELKEITKTTLNELLAQDDLLSDLPKDVTLDEVNNEIALQYGRSITVYIVRGDGEQIPVVVPQLKSTVADLKKCFKKKMTLLLERRKTTKKSKKLSWKYIWKTYNLKYGDEVLTNNLQSLAEFGIKSKSKLHFVKRKISRP